MKVVRNIRVDAEIEQRCKAFMTKIEAKVDSLETKMATQPDRQEFK